MYTYHFIVQHYSNTPISMSRNVTAHILTMWETLAACRDPPEPPPVRYLEYIVRYGGVPGGSQHAAYRVTHNVAGGG